MEISEKREVILNGRMRNVLWVLAVPVMLNNFIQTIYDLTDTYFIGKLGTTEIAAVQFVWPMMFFMMSIAVGLSVATVALISQRTGSGDHRMTARIAGQTLTINFILSLGLGILSWVFVDDVLSLLGAEGALYDRAYEFISVMLFGLPTMFMMFAFNSIRTGIGDTYRPMIFGGLSVVTNIILDPIFIFTLGMGVSGGALATVIARGAFAVIAIGTLFRKNADLKIEFKDLVPDLSILKNFLRIGLPASVGQATTSIGFMVLNLFVIGYGEATLTAFSIGNRINGLILMPAMGIGSALATIVGQNLGANQPERVHQAVRTSVWMTTAILVLGGIVLVTFARPVIGFFTTDPFVISQGVSYLVLITLSIPLMGFFQIFVGVFQGAGRTLYSMTLMLGRLWVVRIPMIFILQKWFSMGPSAVWYSMIFSNLIVCGLGYVLYTRGNWMTVKVTI
jgi:putative MATE family efflux protein